MAKLAKQKAASQPTAPKATAVDSIDDESATESPASLAPETAAAAAAPAAAPAAPKWYELNSVKAALFFSIVPICFALPFAAEYVVEWTRPYVDYLQYVWMGYAAIVAFFYVTKKKHSNDSFFTQLLTWLLLALGSHAVTGFFNFMPPADRMIVLKLWITVTFVPYAIFVWFDDTDHKKREAKEIAKEKKRKQKEELLDEKIAEARRIRKVQMKNFQVASAEDSQN